MIAAQPGSAKVHCAVGGAISEQMSGRSYKYREIKLLMLKVDKGPQNLPECMMRRKHFENAMS